MQSIIKNTGVTETIPENGQEVRENTGFKYTEHRLGKQGTAGAN